MVESNIYRWQSALQGLRKTISNRSYRHRLLSRFACLLATCPHSTMKFVYFCQRIKSDELSYLSNAARSVNTGTLRSGCGYFRTGTQSNRRLFQLHAPGTTIHRSAAWIFLAGERPERSPRTRRKTRRRLKFKTFTTAKLAIIAVKLRQRCCVLLFLPRRSIFCFSFFSVIFILWETEKKNSDEPRETEGQANSSYSSPLESQSGIKIMSG